MISLDPPTNTQARIRVDDPDALRLYSHFQSCSQSGQIQKNANWKLLPSAEGVDIEEAWRRKYRIPLETPRLLLRPLVTEDVDWLTHLFTDERVNRFLWEGASPPGQARRNAEAVVSLDLMRCRFGHWAIQDKSTGAVHGWTELSKLRPWSGPSDEISLELRPWPRIVGARHRHGSGGTVVASRVHGFRVGPGDGSDRRR